MTKLERAKLWYEKMKSLPEYDLKKIKWRERQRKTNNAYFKNNKSKIIERRREYRSQWHLNNREKELSRLRLSYINMKKKDPQKSNYKNYQRRSLKLGGTFGMTLDKFREYVSQNCFYCGSKNAGGIDRIRNEKRYTPKNIVPCCKVCNYMKNTTSLHNFIWRCSLIAEKHK